MNNLVAIWTQIFTFRVFRSSPLHPTFSSVQCSGKGLSAYFLFLALLSTFDLWKKSSYSRFFWVCVCKATKQTFVKKHTRRWVVWALWYIGPSFHCLCLYFLLSDPLFLNMVEVSLSSKGMLFSTHRDVTSSYALSRSKTLSTIAQYPYKGLIHKRRHLAGFGHMPHPRTSLCCCRAAVLWPVQLRSHAQSSSWLRDRFAIWRRNQ